MSRCVIPSSAGAASTNARYGLPLALDEVERIAPQHMRSGETVAFNVALAKRDILRPTCMVVNAEKAEGDFGW